MKKKKIKGEIVCPVCRKERFVVYGDTSGQTSQHCGKCGRLLLLDYDSMDAVSIRPQELQSKMRSVC